MIDWEELKLSVFKQYQEWEITGDGKYKTATPTGRMSPEGQAITALIDEKISKETVVRHIENVWTHSDMGSEEERQAIETAIEAVRKSE